MRSMRLRLSIWKPAMKNPFEVMTKIRNAGAIFIGEYSSEPLGDYFAGPNDMCCLLTGTAKFFSSLSVDDFIRKSSVVYYSREALESIHEDIIKFAKAEQLTAHANPIAVRFGREGRDQIEGDSHQECRGILE